MPLKELLFYKMRHATYYWSAIICFAIISLIFVVILYKVLKRKNIKQRKMIVTFFTYFLGVIIITLLGRKSQNEYLIRPFLWSFRILFNGDKSVLGDLVLNTILFVPYGIILPILINNRKKLYYCLVLGSVISGVIEIIQYIYKLGFFEVDDIICNTIGIWIGYSIIMLHKKLKK